jgi:hypothetical protein
VQKQDRALYAEWDSDRALAMVRDAAGKEPEGFDAVQLHDPASILGRGAHAEMHVEPEMERGFVTDRD